MHSRWMETTNLKHQTSNIKHLKSSYHLVGIAGAGMSPLAQILLAQGARVSGSDRYLDKGENLDVLVKLRTGGADLVPQDGSGVKPGLAAVVVSTAIEKDNPDLAAAERLGIPVIHRAAMLADLARGHELVAVTGTCGKTTVTGMIGWILEQAGVDPTVVNGGALLNWMSESAIGNNRAGGSDLWVIEADESDRSLMRFTPDWAVITNASKDHFEAAEAEALFKTFAAKTRRGVVGCFSADAARDSISDFRPALSAIGCCFEYGGKSFRMSLPGAHNAENALHSIMLCEKLGVDLDTIKRALGEFKGIQRRLERVGVKNGVSVFDDHAHNPAKIMAAWRAMQSFHKRIVAVWRPHGFRPLALMANELADTFALLARGSDVIHILPVYFAGGTAKRVLDSEKFVAELKKRGVPAEYSPGYDELLERLMAGAMSGDAVLFFGARDPGLPVFARRFLAELRHLVV